jgi:hypothetical protein
MLRRHGRFARDPTRSTFEQTPHAAKSRSFAHQTFDGRESEYQQLHPCHLLAYHGNRCLDVVRKGFETRNVKFS